MITCLEPIISSLSQLFGFNPSLSLSIPFLSSTVMLSFFHICFDSFLPLKHLGPFSLGCRVVVILKSYTRGCVRLVGGGGVSILAYFLPRSEGSHSCQGQTFLDWSFQV